ncbi:MAG: hypothetical protein E6Q58_00420 [Niabella sp.]|nr:MAG: hypothetical protein E6Q58_00420 [Niabella sp.]
MSFTHKGKEVLTAISSLNVNFSRDLYGDSLYAGSRYIYCSLTPMTVGKALLAAISENKAEFDILVTQTDNINKEKKQMLLKNAVFTSYNDGFSTFSYDNNYSNISLSVSAKSVIINGIEIKP